MIAALISLFVHGLFHECEDSPSRIDKVPPSDKPLRSNRVVDQIFGIEREEGYYEGAE